MTSMSQVFCLFMTITPKGKISRLRIYVLPSLLLLSMLIMSKIYPDIAQHQIKLTDLIELWYRDSSYNTISYNNKLPLFCQENLFDQRSFSRDYLTNAKQLMVVPKNKCELFVHTSELVSTCLDVLKPTGNDKTVNNKRMLHFAFVGDSRIRQQFFNFLKLVPEYDRRVYPNPITPFHHGYISVNSSLLNLRLTFHWHSVIDDEAIHTIRQWIIHNEVDPPHFVLLGMAAHHMLSSDIGSDRALQLYRHKLLEFVPFLVRLANVSQVVWLNQYPTLDFYGDMYDHNTDIHAEKIHRYNQVVRLIFRDHNSIRLWDSGNSLAEEYVRSCVIYSLRKSGTRGICGDFLCDSENQKIHETLYRNCKDFIHTGYVALSQATQLLLNDICNKNIAYSFTTTN